MRRGDVKGEGVRGGDVEGGEKRGMGGSVMEGVWRSQEEE